MPILSHLLNNIAQFEIETFMQKDDVRSNMKYIYGPQQAPPSLYHKNINSCHCICLPDNINTAAKLNIISKTSVQVYS